MANVTVKKTEKLSGQVCAPPSKSYTQRMVIAAALSHGTSKVSNPLLSEDTEATLRAITALGAKVKVGEGCWTIQGTKTLKGAKEPINCGESGATLRFMIPIAALAKGSSTLVFRGSIEKRPVEPLLASLRELGAKVHSGKLGDKDAVFVDGGGIVGGETSIAGNVSSQFISGLMFACPMADVDTEIMLTHPLESADYVKMTQAVLANHGIKVPAHENHIHIPANQTYTPSDGRVPGDFSSAAFLFAAAAITNSKVQINNLDYDSVQGDKAILGILKHMGVNEVCEDSVEIKGSGTSLKPIEVDAKHIPDLVPAIAVLACYAKDTSHIFGAHRLRLKESDRLQSLYTELTKMGAQISIDNDGLIIEGGNPLHGAIIDPHNDHRIAMACAVAALGAEGQTTIQNAECVRKSYPQFFTHLKQLGADVVGGKFDR
ncbi:MAG: 3-phosphoshikimate 1-carboxyvinyltransferase [Candidatus Bathyarchaeota archaeon]|nr:3-phosphoshikimate 1-carboxyvinyltransferase [Candidatus Bathyarchaeota archaeon]